MVYGGAGELVIDFRLEHRALRRGELALRLQDEEDRLGAQLILPLLGLQALARKVRGHARCIKRNAGLFKLMHSSGHLKRDILFLLTRLVLASPAADQSIAQVRFRAMVLDGKIQRQGETISWVAETADLAKGITQPATGEERGRRDGSVILVASQAVGIDKSRSN